MGGSDAPMAYQPANQAGADQQYYSGLSTNAANMNSLYNTANQGFSSLYNNTLNNPYYSQALTSAQNVATQGAATAGNETSLGTGLANLIPGILGQASASSGAATSAGVGASNTSNALAGAAAGYAPTAVGQANGVYDAGASYLPQIMAAYGQNAQTANSLIPSLVQSGYDPQSALYNQQLQTATDTSKAQSAAAGLAGSPFAAGQASDAATNFNLNWQNQQQARQLAGATGIEGLLGSSNSSLGGATSALTGVGGLMDSASSTGVNNLATLLGSAQTSTNSGLSNLLSALTSSMGFTNSGVSDANTLNSDYVGDASKALDTLSTTGQFGADVYNNQQTAASSQLQALVSALTSINGQQATDTSGFGQYLGIGQNATQIDDQATEYNNQSSLMGGLGSLLGTLGQLGGASTGGGGTVFGDLGL